MAIIAAIIIVLALSQVDIYTNSKSVIDKFCHLNSCRASYFCYSRLTLNDTYSDLWFLLFHIIQLQQLTIRFHKVKAHVYNYWNNYTNRLAKSAHLSSECFQILPYNLYSIVSRYRHYFTPSLIH